MRERKMKILVKQTGRQVQRMRNILAILLAMFVCTSICLGDTGQTITISEDIVDQDKVRELELELLPLYKLQPQQLKQLRLKLEKKQRQQLERKVLELESQLPLLKSLPPPELPLDQPLDQQLDQPLDQQLDQQQLDQQQLASVHQRIQQMLGLKNYLQQRLPLPLQQLEQLTQLRLHLPDLELKLKLQLERQLEQQPTFLLMTQLELEQQPKLQQQLKSELEYPDIAGNGNPNKDPDKYKYGKALDGDIWNNPNNNHLIIDTDAKVGNAYGAKMNNVSVIKNEAFKSMTNNDVIVSGGEFGCGDTDGNIAGAWADDDIDVDMNISSNTVIITGGSKIGNVYGGRTKYGTVSSNTVTISNSVTIERDVYGAWIGKDERIEGEDEKVGEYGLASSNTVTITSGKVRNVYGGYIVNNGTATLNKVNLTSVTVRLDVYGAKIGNDERIGGKAKKVVGDGLASSNTVTITSGKVGWNVYGGYIVNNGTATGNKVNLSDVDVTRDVYGAKIGKDGDASSNEVTITGGRVGGYVLGGYVYNDGTATGNKVNLTNVDVTRDVYGAMVGTDKKAEFEKAMEESTEVYAKALALQVKFMLDITGMNKAEEAEFEKRFKEEFELELKETAEALKASEGALSHLAKAAFERAGKVEKSKFEEDEKAIIGIENEVFNKVIACITEFEEDTKNKNEEEKIKEFKTKRPEFEKRTKEKIEEFKAKRTELKKDGVAELKKDVIAEIERAEAKRARTYVLASSNTVTITSGTVGRDVYGGYIVNNGTATLNTVNLTSVTATKDVYGAWIGNDGLASSNTVTINGGTVGLDVYGGYIVKNGTATGNTVTISGGKVKGNVFGGYVGGKGEATYNTINITAFTEFSPESILCGGICDPAAKSNVFTGNTLNIETKGVEVKGISNFEKYKFNLKDIKPGDTVLTATGGGCSWDIREHNYTSDCAVDISRSNMNISLHTQGVLNKGDQYTLIKSPHGFEGEVETKQCDFENEGLLIKYYWNIKIADNKQELIAKLIDKKIRDEGVSRSLSEGYGAGVVCVNNGMDCVVSKIEETELLAKLQRKGEIGAFGGLAASKSKYDIDKGSHINMIGTSMMGGVGVRVEVGRKEQSSKEQSSKEQNSKEQNSSEQSSEQSSPELSSKKPSSKELGSELTVGVFAEHGTGESDIHCEKKSKGTSSYTGGGLLGRYNIYENEFSGTKLYGEAILRAGQVENNFDSKKMKDSKGKEYKYKYADAMYGGCAVGGGYKHKVSEKIDLDWSLRYMFGRQWEKDVKREDADGNRMKFENVTSNRIRIGVRGKYVELEKVKPYAGIGCEYELDGKVKGTIENGADIIGIPASDFGGVTGIGELGVSGNVWKFGVDISGQGYLGVRKGFGGMLKLKYAFGKDAHGSKASSLAPRSKSPGSKSPS